MGQVKGHAATGHRLDNMKIGLFGDSFGYQTPNTAFEGWVDLLSKHYKISNYCKCGIGEYKILKQLQRENLSQFDCLIITHTSATRTFVPYNPLHYNSVKHQNCDIIYADIADRTDDFSVACQQYFKYIFDLQYAIDLHNMICKEVNEVCVNHKVIHITHFDYNKLYHFPDMINFYSLWVNNRGSVNHYNQLGNQQVYQAILKRTMTQ